MLLEPIVGLYLSHLLVSPPSRRGAAPDWASAPAAEDSLTTLDEMMGWRRDHFSSPTSATNSRVSSKATRFRPSSSTWDLGVRLGHPLGRGLGDRANLRLGRRPTTPRRNCASARSLHLRALRLARPSQCGCEVVTTMPRATFPVTLVGVLLGHMNRAYAAGIARSSSALGASYEQPLAVRLAPNSPSELEPTLGKLHGARLVAGSPASEIMRGSRAGEPPVVFRHYHVRPDGTVEVSVTHGVRVYVLGPDGSVQEHVAVCLEREKVGKHGRLPERDCAVAALLGGSLYGVAGLGFGTEYCAMAGPGTMAVCGGIGTVLGSLPWALWGLNGCPGSGPQPLQLPPGYTGFDYSLPGGFDYSFPGGFFPRGAPIINPWWEGVGNGVCTGGDVLRVPTVEVDGRVGSTNPTDVWVGYTFGSPPFAAPDQGQPALVVPSPAEDEGGGEGGEGGEAGE
jgi:hypothetical protein